MARETIGRTFTVALLLCVVCSVLVSGAAVVLQPTQAINELLDKKRNILMAAGLAEEGRTIDELFEGIDVRVVDLATGGYVDGIDPGTYDYIAAAADPEEGVGHLRAGPAGRHQAPRQIDAGLPGQPPG